MQERTQPKEMVHVQMSLLPAQRSDFRCLTVCLPDLVPLLGLLRGLSVPQVVFPDRKPLFQEPPSHSKLTTNRPSQESRESMTLLGGQILSSMEEQGAVQPQVFTESADLLPVVPGSRRWVNVWQQVGRAAQFGDGGRIGWRELEPLADRAMVDPELAPNGTSGRDVPMQCMRLSNAERAPRQAPTIAF
jgi:hypothetical protein